MFIAQDSLILWKFLSYIHSFTSFHCERVSGMTQISFCLSQHSRHKLQLEQFIGAWYSTQNNAFVPSVEELCMKHFKAFAQVKSGR